MEIRVKVINQEGAPVADAKVEASGRGGAFADDYSDAAGVLRFYYSREDFGDTCKISVSKSGFQDHEKVHHIHSESLREFTITLLPKNGAVTVVPEPVQDPEPVSETDHQPVPPPPPPRPVRPFKFLRRIIIILGAVCILVAIAGVAAWWFVIGSKVHVPPVVGKNLEEAGQSLTKFDLVADQALEIVAPDQPPNQVVAQDPPPDQLVARGSHVKLTVGSPKAEVPALAGMNFDQAVQRLTTEYHLVGERAGTALVPLDRPANQVVSQDPPPGQLVDPGSTVKLTISVFPAAPYPGERFPETRLKLLTKADIADWSYPQLRYAINEMYARHGSTFPDAPDIENQFRKFPWYQPAAGRTFDQSEASFSQIETQNLKVLTANISTIVATAIAASELQLQLVYDHLKAKLPTAQKERLRENETQFFKWKDSLPANSNEKLDAIQNRIRLLQSGGWEK